MSLNPATEVTYRYRLALEHLKRAEKLSSLRDWVGTVAACQLSVESFAKAVIAAFEVPTWSHDPSNQLHGLLRRLPADSRDDVEKLADLAREMAPEHGRSTCGEPTAGILPSDIYGRDHASDSLHRARKARKTTQRVIRQLSIRV